MVDEKKVRTMIELARYEEGEGKEDLRIRRFYRGDYLTVQLIKNWFLTTISYILLLALLVGGNLEFLMNNLDSMDLPVVISLILIGYVALIGLYLSPLRACKKAPSGICCEAAVAVPHEVIREHTLQFMMMRQTMYCARL